MILFILISWFTGDCTHLERVFSKSHQELRNTWCNEAKVQRELIDNYKIEGCQWELNWDLAKKTYNTPHFDLFVPFVAAKLKRHIVIIGEDYAPLVINGNMFSSENIENKTPILLCRIGGPNKSMAEHYQTIVSNNSKFWEKYCMDEINKNYNSLQTSDKSPDKNMAEFIQIKEKLNHHKQR